jgi:hypothetical protein
MATAVASYFAFAHVFGRSGGEEPLAEVAPELAELIHGRAKRRLPEEAHQEARFGMGVDLAPQAFRTLIAWLEAGIRDPHALRAGVRGGS